MLKPEGLKRKKIECIFFTFQVTLEASNCKTLLYMPVMINTDIINKWNFILLLHSHLKPCMYVVRIYNSHNDSRQKTTQCCTK